MMILQEMRKRNRQTNENDKKNIDDSPTWRLFLSKHCRAYDYFCKHINFIDQKYLSSSISVILIFDRSIERFSGHYLEKFAFSPMNNIWFILRSDEIKCRFDSLHLWAWIWIEITIFK
jgi:hypothetical protein